MKAQKNIRKEAKPGPTSVPLLAATERSAHADTL